MPLSTGYLLIKYGLNGALLLLAGIMLQGMVIGLLHPTYFKDKNASINNNDPQDIHKMEPNKKENVLISRYRRIVTNPSYWCLITQALANECLSNGSRVFLIDRAVQDGIEKQDAIFALSMFGISSALAKFLVRIPFINKTPTRRQFTLSVMEMGWALATMSTTLNFMKSYKGFLAYCLLAGLFHGISTLLWYLTIADIMPRELVVTAYGLQCFIAAPFVMFTIPFAGWIYDRTSNYDTPYIIYGAIGIFASLCILLVPVLERRKNKANDVSGS